MSSTATNWSITWLTGIVKADAPPLPSRVKYGLHSNGKATWHHQNNVVCTAVKQNRQDTAKPAQEELRPQTHRWLPALKAFQN
jgi:hypothetical protein